jgi:two-component system heavy metal sensor histidine kinase CusS
MPSRLLSTVPWATLRFRLTVWNTLVVLLITLMALLAVKVGAKDALYREADAVLRGEVNEVTIALRDLYPNTDAVVDELRRKAVGHEERGWFTQLLTDDGTTIWKSDSCPPEVASLPVTREKFENLRQVGGYRFARRRITDPADEPFHVRIGMATAFLDDDIDTLTRLLLPVALGLSLLTPLVGYWLAVRATKPVAEILRTAEQLKPTRLGDRLKVHGTQDELDRLSLTINRLLDEVAGHVERQQQFVADAAHELRGPLAAMRTSLEVAISQDRTADAYRETIADVLEEARHLSKLANDLLLLAETGDEPRERPRERVDLTAVARQTMAMFGGVAEERAVGLVLQPMAGPVRVAGDASQLRQVLGNLLDNAIRFTPSGGMVTVSIGIDGERRDAILTVADTGCGIDEDHLGHVFDRFYKTDASRTHGESVRGGGLGLSICRSIVERHGGSIGVRSTVDRGTTFTVQLPSV